MGTHDEELANQLPWLKSLKCRKSPTICFSFTLHTQLFPTTNPKLSGGHKGGGPLSARLTVAGQTRKPHKGSHYSHVPR